MSTNAAPWRLPAVACLMLTATLVLEGAPRDLGQQANAQEPASLAAQLDQADQFAATKRHDEAAALYDAALAAAQERASDPEIARALVGRADLRFRQRRSADGLADARDGLAIFERLNEATAIARASLVLGLLEHATGATESARALFTRSLETYTAAGDHAGAARAGLRLGGITRDADTRVRILGQVAEDARLAGQAEMRGDALHDMGDALFGVERYEEAMAALESARALFESIGDRNRVGTVHNSMGRVYRAHGRLDEALREQKRALELHRQAGDPATLLQSLNAVGVTYQRMGLFEDARGYLEQALTVAPRSGVARAQDFLEANIAGLMVDAGDYAPAVATLERVITRGLDSFPAVRYGQLAHAYYQLGRYEDALKAADSAISLCAEARDICARAHSSRAAAQAALGNRIAARADNENAMTLLEQVRKQLMPSDLNRRDFLRNLEWVYTRAIGLLVADGDARASLEAAEQARARAFLDLLGSRALPVQAVPALPLTLRDEAGGPGVYPTGAATTVDDLIATAARLSSTMIAYWVGDDETFVWVVEGSGRLHSHRIVVSRQALVRLVRETQPFVQPDAPPGKPALAATRGASPVTLASGDAAWRRLYSLLIAPISQFLPRTPGALLTIVPHGVLNGVSFAALKSPRGRYLLEDFTLHYAPTGGLFQFTGPRRQTDARRGSVLLVADPAPPRRSTLDENLPRLPGTRVESAAIAGYAGRGRATLLQDGAATEATVRNLASARTVLHFATHAIVLDDKPFDSHLLLARSGAGDASDGVLTAQELYGMRLNADLVVLSACRSAAGVISGEAMATFTRAFFYAGTASLVASLWDVADEPTNLIPSFYQAWYDGADKASALRRAQLQLLAELRAGRVRVTTAVGPVPLPEHPVFWAGFVMFGEPR